jgi:hypothetical protein
MLDAFTVELDTPAFDTCVRYECAARTAIFFDGFLTALFVEIEGGFLPREDGFVVFDPCQCDGSSPR